MKKIYIYLIILILSICFSICNNNNITNNSELIIPIILTLLGLCLTSYIFICSPIGSTVSKNKKLKNSAINLLSKLEEDIKTIFFISLIIILLTIMKDINFVFIKDPLEIDFGLFVIKSFKLFILNSMISYFFMLSLVGFYDFIIASFKITKGLLFIDNE